MKARELNRQEFIANVADVVNSNGEWKFLGDKPALIDFYASWCGPCNMLAPIIEEVARDYNGQIDVYKIDVDKEEALASVFGIRSIPTLLFVPMSGMPTRASGVMPRHEISQMLDQML